MAEAGGYIAIALFLVGVIYQVGRISVRVESLEAGRRDVSNAIAEIHAAIRHIELLVAEIGAQRRAAHRKDDA